MSMDRRQLLKTAGGAGAAAFLSRCGSPSAPPRPNIVVVMTDDQTAAQMSCAGHQILQTPAMDRLATEGVVSATVFARTRCVPLAERRSSPEPTHT